MTSIQTRSTTVSLIVIDRLTIGTVGAGMIIADPVGAQGSGGHHGKLAHVSIEERTTRMRSSRIVYSCAAVFSARTKPYNKLIENRGDFPMAKLVIVADQVLGILASIIVMGFTRQREFRADAGGASLARRGAMIAVLERLYRLHPQPLPDKMAAFGIAGGGAGGIKRLFMTHSPLAERIAALNATVGR